MTAVDKTPSNRNFLSPLNFQFSVKRAPNVNFFLQKVNIPGLRLPTIEIPNQFVPIPTQFARVEYSEFDITFKIDEDFKNYLEIHNWIRALGSPENYQERAAIDAIPGYTGDGTVSDISLITLNSAKNPNMEITFVDAFPVRLGDIVFDTTYDDVQFITCDAVFKYTSYEITKI
jgi:hypothetical protein